MKVGIIGLGLIGGSLARDLSDAGWRVTGTDRDDDTLRAAIDSGTVQAELDEGVQPLDLIVVAVPVRSALDVVRRLGRGAPNPSSPVITDVGSTKRSVVDAAVAAGLSERFVGGHPMVGDHRSGWSAARSGLFRGAPVWLCPAPDASPSAVGRVESLWAAVGGRTRRIDAAEHDRRMSFTSHLPQATSSALAATLASADLTPDDLGAGGRDATRLAGSDTDVWADILLDNADEVGPALDALVDNLRGLRHGIASRDGAAIRDWLETARAWPASFRSTPRTRGDIGGKNAPSR